MVLVSGTLLSVLDIVVHGKRVGVVEGIWQNLLRALEPAAMEADVGWALRLQSLFVVLFGILVGSSLIGLIASGIDRRVTELRKGRSEVCEEGHTLILGWSEKIFPVIAELVLVLGHRGRRDSCIVILADHDKIGIVLGNNHPDGDARVIRSVLALMDDEERFADLRLVADCASAENADALREATGGHAIAVASPEIIARVAAQACRHTGLGTVFQELLDFGGVDVHFHQDARVSGRRFGDLVMAYERWSPIGIRYPDGVVELNPSDDQVVADDDLVVVVAAGLDDVDLRPEPADPPSPPPASHPASHGLLPNRVLMVGWNPLAPRIIAELDRWVAPGSTIKVLVDDGVVAPEEASVSPLANLAVSVSTRFASMSHTVARLCAEEQYDRVVVLGYRGRLTAHEAGARTLMTLLELRQFRETHPQAGSLMSVLAEVLDIRDVRLARVAGAEDLIVSERITALMLAQLAELPERERVFADLFETTGSEVCMRPVSDFADPRPGLPYGSYVAAAHGAGHLAIGYRSTSVGTGDLSDAIHLDPPKSATVDLQPHDRLIIVTRRDASSPAVQSRRSAPQLEGTSA